MSKKTLVSPLLPIFLMFLKGEGRKGKSISHYPIVDSEMKSWGEERGP